MTAAFDDFRHLVDQFPDLVCRYRPDGLLLYVNAAYAAFHGRTRHDLVGRSFLELCGGDLRDDVEIGLRRVQQLTPAIGVVWNEHRCRDHEGDIRWFHWTDKGVFDSAGQLVEVMAIGRDVTDRRVAEEHAVYLAAHDSLTGLLNRRSLLQFLEDELALCRRREQTLAVLYVDLDRFKNINDERGHDVGDRVLEEVAERLVAGFRVDDLLGRIGGDEFVIACPDTDHDEVVRLVDRAHSMLAEPMVGLDDVVIRASIGWAMSDGTDLAGDLLKGADAAMYAMKAARSSSRAGEAKRPTEDPGDEP